jgi:hypothetical protein
MRWQMRYIVMYLAIQYETTKTVMRIPEEKVEPGTALCREKL